MKLNKLLSVPSGPPEIDLTCCNASSHYSSLDCTNALKQSNDLKWSSAGSNTWAANGAEPCVGTWIEVKLADRVYAVSKVGYRQRYRQYDQGSKMEIQLKDFYP